VSKLLGNFIEVLIPGTLMKETRVREAFDNSVIDLGGCTLTGGRGFYVRQDNGKIDAEHVITARWEYAEEDDETASLATGKIVDALLEAGEESVLARGYSYGNYYSKLIFA
jgi:hypothetical protein